MIGGIGILATFLLGFVHVGGHSHGGHAGHAAHGHAGHAGHAGAHHVGGHDSGHFDGGHNAGKIHFSAQSFKSVAKGWLTLSPLDLFGLCMGAGAAGLLFQSAVKGSLLPWVAAAGAIIFCFLILKPLGNLMEKFVSTPSEGLEGVVAKPAEAVINFDANGRGLVRIKFDGAETQILGMLEPHEVEAGVKVRKGDNLLVIEVDSKRNTCRVTRELE